MKKLILPLIITILVSLSSCKCNEDFDLDRDFFIWFELHDESGTNLLKITSYYHPDSVKIYDNDSNLVYPGPVPGGGRVAFYPYKNVDKEIPLDQDVTEYFYLHLVEQGLDIDTFKLEYRAILDDCNEKEFTYLNFYYNEKLVYESQNPRNFFFVELVK